MVMISGSSIGTQKNKQDKIGYEGTAEYLASVVLSFDILILNTDRHFNNIGIIADAAHGTYRNAPIFDNGNSLLSNVGEFPFDEPLESCLEKVTGQPFSVNLERQAWELGYGLKINYHELYGRLDEESDTRALHVLKFQWMVSLL